MPYVDAESLNAGIQRLHGTAHHFFKIWLVLKQMGMDEQNSVEITTSSPNSALQRLFSYGNPEGGFFVPFAGTERYKTMMGDAGRSIIQTNIRRWEASGSVVTVDPTSFLSITENEDDVLVVRPSRRYPLGLGHGLNGFAATDNARAAVPDIAFAVWYFRQTQLPPDIDREALRSMLRSSLSLSIAEMDLVFVPDESADPSFQADPLSDEEIFEIVQTHLNSPIEGSDIVISESRQEHELRVRSMVTVAEGPAFVVQDPVAQFRQLVSDGAKAILLYGPPRTSKSYSIDETIPRNSSDRETIQIHDGWSYSNLMLGLRLRDGEFKYESGALLDAIRGGKKYIVLEEVNRAAFSQVLGEAFSLIEEGFRGAQYAIRLADGTMFHIPEDVCLICTMNTIDKSTEEVDDALFGRVYAVEFRPRVEALSEILETNRIDPGIRDGIRRLFTAVQEHYPLGHSFFAELRPSMDPVEFYLARIRPVLQNHLAGYRDDELQMIDNKVDELFIQT